MLFHMLLMVAPNPSVAIFGPIKAAAKALNNATTMPIGFAFNTILKAF